MCKIVLNNTFKFLKHLQYYQILFCFSDSLTLRLCIISLFLSQTDRSCAILTPKLNWTSENWIKLTSAQIIDVAFINDSRRQATELSLVFVRFRLIQLCRSCFISPSDYYAVAVQIERIKQRSPAVRRIWESISYLK